MKEKVDRKKPVLLYQQFAEVIREAIRSGKYKPGEYIPPERQLSSEFNLNRLTVRKGIALLIDEGLLQPLRGRGTFIIGAPQRKDKGSNKSIAYIFIKDFKFPLSRNPYYTEILEGAEDEASKANYSFFLFSVSYDEKELNKVMRKVIQERFSGVVMVGRLDKQAETVIIELYKRDIPMALIDKTLDYYNINSIVSDNAKGAYDAVKYLVSLGHKDIAFIGASPKKNVTQERLRGAEEALSEVGLKFDPQWVAQSDLHVHGGYKAMSRILESAKRPSAVFAINDETAIGAMRAINEKNLQIPTDISVIGFDDIDWAAYTAPPLTTVKIYKKEIGSSAVKKVIDQIEGKTFLSTKSTMPTELIIRQSCIALKKKRSKK
jgi:DNA-binding LacI/PurR family transcriptional regulator